jgi:mono/diheme cytochrome c family protein
MRKSLVWCAAGLFAGVMAFAVTSRAEAPDGKALYADKCVKCHGDKGQGDPKATKTLCEGVDPEKLKLDVTAKKTDADMYKQISDGTENMPGYKEKMTADEIKAVIAYVRTLIPKK